MITMSEETKKFQEAVNSYFDYNKDGFTQEKGYWLLLLLCLIKNDALRFINSKQTSIYEKSQLKVIFYCPLKDLYNGTKLTDKDDRLYLSDCLVIDYPEKVNVIQEIADGLGLNLSYEYHRMYRNENLILTSFKLLSISPAWYEENSAWAFKEICNKISEKRYSDFFIQPQEVSSLIIDLLDSQSGRVYNPYANIHSIDYINATSKYKNLSWDFFMNRNESYHLIRLASLLFDKDPQTYSMVCSKDLDLWFSDIRYDYIVSTPPWGGINTKSEYRTLELDYLANSSKNTLHKSIGVYTTSLCFNSSRKHKEVISSLVNDDILDTIILLPKNLFYSTSISTVIILVNKHKNHKGFVKFLDASNMFKREGRINKLALEMVLDNLKSNSCATITISNDEIKYNNYNIDPLLYTSYSQPEIPEDYIQIELDEIIEKCRGERRYEETEGYLATTSNLSSNILSSQKSVQDFKLSTDLSNSIKIEEPVLLISKIRDLKPTFCIASTEDPLFVHPNVSVYKIRKGKEWIDTQYLCYEINRRVGNTAIGIIPYYSMENLLKTKIGIPSQDIAEQKRVIEELRHQYVLTQARELGLLELIESMKAEYMNEIRMRKHDMRPHLTNLGSIGRLMQSYIKELDGMPELQNKLSSLVAEHVKAVESLSNLVSVLSEEQTFGKAEEINLNQLFIDLEKSNDPKISGFKLVYHIDRNALDASEISNDDDSTENIPLYVKIARIDFERLVSNILENARTHGFANREDNNGVVNIFVTVNSENDSFQIDFINNGNPLPDGMNKMRFGLRGEKAGNTGGTGNGGYIIKSIVEHYKGDYDVFMDADDTVIRVLLPISRESYE